MSPPMNKTGAELVAELDGQVAEYRDWVAKTKLKMPMLVLAGERASGDLLIQQARMVADNVEGVTIKGSGHWLMDEAPDQVVPKLVAFFSR